MAVSSFGCTNGGGFSAIKSRRPHLNRPKKAGAEWGPDAGLGKVWSQCVDVAGRPKVRVSKCRFAFLWHEAMVDSLCMRKAGPPVAVGRCVSFWSAAAGWVLSEAIAKGRPEWMPPCASHWFVSHPGFTSALHATKYSTVASHWCLQVDKQTNRL